MMKILFDLVATQPVHGALFHGGGEYSKAVFAAAVSKGHKFDVLYDSRLFLDPEIESICKENSINMVDLDGRNYVDAYSSYDVFFTGMPYGKFGSEREKAQNAKTKLIFTIHGVRSLEMPIDRYEIPFYIGTKDPKRILKALFIRLFPRYYRSVAAGRVRNLLSMDNSVVITVSQHTKYSLLNFFPDLSPDKLVVCYSPLYEEGEHKIDEYREILSSMDLVPGEYYLGLGSGRWLKNNLRLSRAYDKLISDGRVGSRKRN